MSPRLSIPRGPWLETSALLVFVALMLQNFTQHVDLHIADEVMYQIQGRQLLGGEVSSRTILYGPVYSAAYALLQLLPVRGAPAQDLMGVLVVAGSTLLVWWSVAAFAGRAPALLAAAWWGSAFVVIAHPLKIYAFNAALAFAVVGLVARGRHLGALLVLLLAACNRTEFAFWLLPAALLIGWQGRRQGDRRRWRLALPFAAAGAVLLAIVALSPATVERSWFVFQGHYVGHFTMPTATGVELPMAVGTPAADAVVAENFPGANSVLSAAAVNPTEFVRHLLDNLRQLPGNAAQLVVHSLFHQPIWSTMALVAALLLALLGAGAARLGAAPPPAVQPAAGAGAVLWSSLCMTPVLLLVYPRIEYLMALSPLIWIPATRWAARGFGWVCHRLGVSPPAELAVCAALGAAIVLGGPFLQTPADERRGREAVAVLQRNALPPGAILSAPHGSYLLTLAGQAGIASVEPQDVFGTAPATGPVPSHVLLTMWDYLPPYRDALLAEITGPDWRLVDSNHSAWLFARRPQ